MGVLIGGNASVPGDEVTGSWYARQPTIWPSTDTDSDWTGSQVKVPISAGTTVTGWAFYSTASSGDLLAWGRVAVGERSPVSDGGDA